MSAEASSTQTPVIDLVDVVALIGPFPALAGATLRVDRGEILLLRGPNGAGKTTLLRLCAGLLPIERGTAHVLGHDLRIDRELVRRRVGLIGHQNGLYADLTVTENVRFWGRTIGATDDEVSDAMARMSTNTVTLRDMSFNSNPSRFFAAQQHVIAQQFIAHIFESDFSCHHL